MSNKTFFMQTCKNNTVFFPHGKIMLTLQRDIYEKHQFEF